MNIVTHIQDFFIAPSVPEINRRATLKAVADERRHWRTELRKAERRARECREELSKLDEIEATR